MMLVRNWAVAIALLMSFKTARGNTNSDLPDNAKPFRPPNDDFDRFTLFNCPLQQHDHETKTGRIHDERDYIRRWDEEAKAYEPFNNRFLRQTLRIMENRLLIRELLDTQIRKWNEPKENDPEIDAHIHDVFNTYLEIAKTITCLEHSSWRNLFLPDHLARSYYFYEPQWYETRRSRNREPKRIAYFEKVLNENIALADFFPGAGGRFYLPPPENRAMRSLGSGSENSGMVSVEHGGKAKGDTNPSPFHISPTAAITVAAVSSGLTFTGLIALAWYKLSRKGKKAKAMRDGKKESRKLKKRSELDSEWASVLRCPRRHQRQWDVDRR
jgi:hypothetical protein